MISNKLRARMYSTMCWSWCGDLSGDLPLFHFFCVYVSKEVISKATEEVQEEEEIINTGEVFQE